MIDLEQIKRDPVSRRAFLTRMGAAGLGVAAISLLQGCGGGSSGNGNNSGLNNLPATLLSLPGRNADQKVLNFALTLEILEADLYRQALNYATGKPLTDPLVPFASRETTYNLSVPSGGLDGFNTAAGFAYLRDFAYIEAAHRDFLRTVLGTTAVAANPKGYQFANGVAPARDLKSILSAIIPLEETGVRAYLGAAGFITNVNTTQVAVGIYSTEARHSSAINYILGLDPGPNFMAGDNRVVPAGPGVSDNTFEYFLTPAQVVSAIQPLLVK
jgi:hypothetical protein